MAKVAKKKVIIVIVEGPSDEEALSYNLQKMYATLNKDVIFKVVHCDLTTEEVSKKGIAVLVGDVIKNVLTKQKWKPSDVYAVFQITDTDGAYVPDSSIEEDSSCKKIVYKENGIVCQNKEGVIRRNKLKSRNINTLCKKSYFLIKTVKIPYKIVYMSSCLEHVLFDKVNCTDLEKEKLAELFDLSCSDNQDLFYKFFTEEEFVVDGGYAETWSYIKQGNRSLQRFTNLRFLFPSLGEDGDVSEISGRNES